MDTPPTIGIRLFNIGTPVPYIPIDAGRVPCRFSIKLGGRTFVLTVKYNDPGDFFTMDLETAGGEILASGDPVRYGRPLFGSVEDERFPLPVLIPQCFTGDGIRRVTLGNFGREVKLYLHERW